MIQRMLAIWPLVSLPLRGVWKLPLLWLPSQDGSPSLALLSLFLSCIFCPTSFQRWWAAFLGPWCLLLAVRSCFVKFAQRSNVLSMNLYGRKWSPRPIPLPSWHLPLCLFEIQLVRLEVLSLCTAKPSLRDFEHYFANLWNERNWMVACTFFGIAFLWDWNKNWSFPVLWPLLSFPNLQAYWVQHFHSIIFQDFK